MNRVIWHNLSVQYAEPPAGLYDFDQRGIFFTQPGDILLTRKIPDPTYLGFLKRIGFHVDQIRFLTFPARLSSATAGIDVLSVVDQLEEPVLFSGTPWSLDSFMFTEIESNLCNALKLRTFLKPEHYHQFGTKTFFRNLTYSVGLSSPRGYSVPGPLSAVLVALWLRAALRVPEIVIKQDEGVAGLGSVRFSDFANEASWVSMLRFLTMNKQGVVPNFSRRFVVEEWVSGSILSPSVQVYISADGKVEIISTHVQIFYEDRMQYRGCYSRHWLSLDQQHLLEREAIILAQRISDLGYRGHLGFNAITLPDGKLLWTEVNPRRVASSYAFQIAQVITSPIKDKKYLMLSIENHNWGHKTVPQVLDQINRHLFNDRTGIGVIPVDFSLMHSRSSITFIAFGETKQQIQELMHYVERC